MSSPSSSTGARKGGDPISELSEQIAARAIAAETECDSHARLRAAILRGLGTPPRLVDIEVIAYPNTGPDRYRVNVRVASDVSSELLRRTTSTIQHSYYCVWTGRRLVRTDPPLMRCYY